MTKRWALWIGILVAVLLAWPMLGQTIVGPEQMNRCDQATFSITVTNGSASQDACRIVVRNDLPNDGFQLVPGSSTITLDETGEAFQEDPADSSWNIDEIRGTPYSLPPGESITVSFMLATSCAAVSGTDVVTVFFEDCAVPGTSLQNQGSTSIEILPGAIVITKTPSIDTASVGDLVTWTLRVENTGLGSVSNVTVTDTLGPGLAFVSAAEGGQATGQTVVWTPGTTPALVSIPSGQSVEFDLTAEVVACQGLVNTADASWGCDASQTCFDTVVDDGTATASLSLVVANPSLSFFIPDITIPYCSPATEVVIPIVNAGAGTARNVSLCCTIPCEITNVQNGASHDDGCFAIPDIPAGETFDLAFDVSYAGDWCSGGPDARSVAELSYANDCGIPFAARPQYGTVRGDAGPRVSISKTGPDTLRPGEIATYTLTADYIGDLSCGTGTAGAITLVDTYPDGFLPVHLGGGVHDPQARTLTWIYDPSTDPPFSASIGLQAPSGCDVCAGPSASTGPNIFSATGMDCCGCPRTAVASVATPILCEGYSDGAEYFTSSIALSTETVLRCLIPAVLTVTHTYTFADDAALDDFLLNEFTYFVDGLGDLQYEPGTATSSGGAIGLVNDDTPAGRLQIRLSDTDSVRGRTVGFSYDLRVLGLSDPSCQVNSYPIQAGIELDPSATSLGVCETTYQDPPAPRVTAEPPSMSLSIDGVPAIQEECATYDATLTLQRTSDNAVPYDVRLVLENAGGSWIEFPQPPACSGVLPGDGTTCAAPISIGSAYEWRFADGFASGEIAAIPLRITVPCGGPLIDLHASAYFDDLCNDDTTYDNACSASASAAASLSLSADVYIRKTPEVLYATERYVQWQIVVHNTGNGAAYKTWIDDVLGPGLVYDPSRSSISDATGATQTPGVDHEGHAFNGVSWLIDELQSGELRTITVAAQLVGCTGLTNVVSTSWGCEGQACQTPRADDSSVVIPPSNLVATSYSPTPVPMCSVNAATVTVKNAGATTVYDVVAQATLPPGLVYLGDPEFRIGNGSWQPAGDPTVSGQTLTWTSSEIPSGGTAPCSTPLCELTPLEVVQIRFNYAVGCAYQGGDLTFQASYETPCGTSKSSAIGRFRVGLTPADVATMVRQVSPEPGQAIDCGGQVTWEIEVSNTGRIDVPMVRVQAVLDSGLIYITSSGDPVYGPSDGGSDSGQTVVWELVDLPVDAVATLTLTAASAAGGADCEALGVFVNAAWGCGLVDGSSATDDADCVTTAPATAANFAVRRPPVDVAVSLSPDAIEGCAGTATLLLSVENTGTAVTTSNVDVAVALPAHLAYVPGTTEIDCGAGFTPSPDPNAAGTALAWYDVTSKGPGSDACDSIPPGATIRLRFDVTVSCSFTDQSIPIDVYFYDCCGQTQYEANTSAMLNALLPSLTVTKSPSAIDLDCADPSNEITWTLRVINQGSGTADIVRIEDTLGDDLVHVSGGTALGSNPQTWGWEFGPLSPGSSQDVTITARLSSPPDDCAPTRRTNVAHVTWGCGVSDGDPGTTTDWTCSTGTTVSETARVRVPNVSVSASDIKLLYSCSDDRIAPGSGQIQLTIHNTGDGAVPVDKDFVVTLSETTTGYSITGAFSSLGGTLPFPAGTSQTLVFADWPVTCSACDYEVVVSLDPTGIVCECREDDNDAVSLRTITLPDLTIDSAHLTVQCGGDGNVRIEGPITLRNDGCGTPLSETVRMRMRLYDGSTCSGTELESFTLDFASLTIPANGGTATRSIDITRAIDLCGLCQVSIQLEVDDNDAICECSGANNTYCVGTIPLAFPDLEVVDMDFAGLRCSEDGVTGSIAVVVANTGCGPSGATTVRLTSSGCLALEDQPIPALAADETTTAVFPVTGVWGDCGACECEFTATVDPSGTICECSPVNNTRTEQYESPLPNLWIAQASPAIECLADGQARVTGDITVVNRGCGPAFSAALRVTLYDNLDCTGSILDTWIEDFSVAEIPASASRVLSLTPRTIVPSLCSEDCAYSIRFEVDPGDLVCECDGTDNTRCVSPVLSMIPALIITEIDPTVDCAAGTATVHVVAENSGCGYASGVVVRLTSPSCGLSIDSAPFALAAGETRTVDFAYVPDCVSWNCSYAATIDVADLVCECEDEQAFLRVPYPGDGSIGDTVWFDINANGTQDSGEDGIPGVTVTLTGDLDGDGTQDYASITTTDASGLYLFDHLPAGIYNVGIEIGTLPAGLQQTYDADGLTTPDRSETELAEDEDERDQDFGYRGTGAIGDTVWFDANGNGIQEPNEEGIPGVTVTLTGDVDADGVPETVSQTTNESGLYRFDHLPAGDYTVSIDSVTLPSGLQQTYDADGLDTPDESRHILSAGEVNLAQDFGYALPGFTVDKTVEEIVRKGIPIGSTGPVEPGDVITYRFVVRNVGPVPAYGVGFSDSLPSGVEVESDPPWANNVYAVDDPAEAGALALPDGASSFTAPMNLVISGGGTLTATFTARVTSAVSQGSDLTNLATAFGVRADGTSIPTANPLIGDTSDVDSEDPDADDTGVAVLTVSQPALSVDKVIADLVRDGMSRGIGGPAEPGDTIVYRFTIRNVGEGTAYSVGFSDTLPAGVEISADTPLASGEYWVSSPASSGTLGLVEGSSSFVASIGATVSAGEELTATFATRVTSSIRQGIPLVNEATAIGIDGAQAPIPQQNAAAGDLSDSDVEDPDPDDTGIAVIDTAQPALSVEKAITDVVRRGVSIGPDGPVEAGDVVFFRFSIRNVGSGTAYQVEFSDTLPVGMEVEADAPGHPGSYAVTSPAASGSLGLGPMDGDAAFTTSIAATLDGGGTLVATFAARVTSAIEQKIDLTNRATATGRDGFGTPIPPENAAANDTADDDPEDPDPDDTGIATISPVQPGLSVDKFVSGVVRDGVSIGVVDPVLFGDLLVYSMTVRNVGLGTAYGVELSDSLPSGIVVDTTGPHGSGVFGVDAPSFAGSLGLADGADSFLTSIDAVLAGGATLSMTFDARVTPGAPPGLDLVNAVHATGVDGAGTPIPEENAAVADSTDDDLEDPDPDDTGIAIVRVGAPALVTEKHVERIVRGDQPVDTDRVESGDHVTFRLSVRNVGHGPAVDVTLSDILPAGFEYSGNSIAVWPGGGSSQDPVGRPGPDLHWPFAVSLGAGEETILVFDAIVTSAVRQGQLYRNTLMARGSDAAGNPIPADRSDLVPADEDPDDASSVFLHVGEPALVTEKTIANVVRAGQSIGPSPRIRREDVIEFSLTVTNVGLGHAYHVDVSDQLPSPFRYVMGTTEAAWPARIGSYSVDPLGLLGQRLLWRTGADLAPGATLQLRFRAVVDGPVAAGDEYTNVLYAEGTDGANVPIPTDNSLDIPADTDPDDRDETALVGIAEGPALVTAKRVVEVRRDGKRTSDTRVEREDAIRYELTVVNVGTATAYNVSITDQLPGPFTYVPGSTTGLLSTGRVHAEDPRKVGNALLWDLDATLAAGEMLTLTFLATVEQPLVDGRIYANRMEAKGRDLEGVLIPADRGPEVPADTDPDDASTANVVARSEFVDGTGGTVEVPILRKTVESIGAGPCEALGVSRDRLWFQTDLAMFAATEFQRLPAGAAADLDPETLLPTWLVTVRREVQRDALDNVLQVNLLGEMGVPLHAGPRLTSHEGKSTERLDQLAEVAGLDASRRPQSEHWIALEYAGGEPVYRFSEDSALGPRGPWTTVDEAIVASAVGMGLAAQAGAIDRLVDSDEPLDRYAGWVLTEAVANKLLLLNGTLARSSAEETPYVAHAYRASPDALHFSLEDGASTLFDQASVLRGAAACLTLVDRHRLTWPSKEEELESVIQQEATTLLTRTLAALAQRHLKDDGHLRAIADAADAAETALPTTVDITLLLVGLHEASPYIEDRDGFDRLRQAAFRALLTNRRTDGAFVLEPGADASASLELSAQLAGLWGLTLAYEDSGNPMDLERAQQTFDTLDSMLWESMPGQGLYAASRSADARSYCYTPLEVGLATGALRALATVSDPERSAFIFRRLAGFIRTIVNDAALQLSNLNPVSAEPLTTANGFAQILVPSNAVGHPVAPVLEQRLCLTPSRSDAACSAIQTIEFQPRYQTDVSMYAASAIQAWLPDLEDIADANLVAVVFHAGLGVAWPNLTQWGDPRLADAAQALLTAAPLSLSPVFLPYYAGDPRLESSTLAWDETTFDKRIVPSSIGMTLLRESQELMQAARSGEADALHRWEADVLLISALAKANALQAMLADGPMATRYVPHASTWAESSETLPLEITDPRSTLFDQLSLLDGLTELRTALADAVVKSLLGDGGSSEGNRITQLPTANEFIETVDRLIDAVLRTLETAHFDPSLGVLVEESHPDGEAWNRDWSVTSVNVGLATEALSRVIDTYGETSSLGARALAMIEAEVDFLMDRLWHPDAARFEERWADTSPASAPACSAQTVAGQLGGIQAMLVADRLLQHGRADLLDAFRQFDRRFWMSDLQMYGNAADRTSWCVTPLDLGLMIETWGAMLPLLDPETAATIRSRLALHLDAVLNGLDLQLPRTMRLAEIDEPSRYAPVFDRRRCIAPAPADDRIAWANPGGSLHYTIEVENPTNKPFLHLSLRDDLPENVDLISARPDPMVDHGTVQWTLPRLEPGEVRSWELIVHIDEATSRGAQIVNCAVLSATDEEARDLPLREACAVAQLQSPDEAKLAALEDLLLTYHTDAAMRLTAAIGRLDCVPAAGDPLVPTGQDVTAANLGVLLYQSGIGVRAASSPALAATPSPEVALEGLLRSFADAAAQSWLPPSHLAIFLPAAGGTPILQAGLGFVERDDRITPAALGWTMVAEAQFLTACRAGTSPLQRYLEQFVAWAAGEQIVWLEDFMRNRDTPVPHVMALTGTAQEILYPENGVAGTLYDLASLLLGLARVLNVPGLPPSEIARAQLLAGRILDQLKDYEDPELGFVTDPNAQPSPASERDRAIAARAIAEIHSTIPSLRETAGSILSRMGAAAASQENVLPPLEEAARISTLMIASAATGDRTLREAGLAAWDALVAPVPDETTLARALLPSRAKLGWALLPEQLAVLLEVLDDITRSDTQRGVQALHWARDLFSKDIVAAHVQLAKPAGVWQTDLLLPCIELAPVLATWFGAVPMPLP